MFILINRRTLVPKNGGKKSFSYETKASIHLSQWGEWICGAQSLKERRLLCESVFIPIEKWTLILKMVEREVFLMKPRHQYHLSQRGEWTCGGQSLKESRLLCESKFIPIERWTLILKMVEREVFLTKPKHQYHQSQWGECAYGS